MKSARSFANFAFSYRGLSPNSRRITSLICSTRASIGGNGPWDFHAAIYDRTKPQNLYTKCLEWDQAFTALLQDLSAAPGHEPGKTMLDETIIVSTGEFGRTPNFNTGLGRDHYDKTFT